MNFGSPLPFVRQIASPICTPCSKMLPSKPPLHSWCPWCLGGPVLRPRKRWLPPRHQGHQELGWIQGRVRLVRRFVCRGVCLTTHPRRTPAGNVRFRRVPQAGNDRRGLAWNAESAVERTTVPCPPRRVRLPRNGAVNPAKAPTPERRTRASHLRSGVIRIERCRFTFGMPIRPTPAISMSGLPGYLSLIKMRFTFGRET